MGMIIPYSPLLFTAKSNPTVALPSSVTIKLPESPGNAKGSPSVVRTVHVFLNQTEAENFVALYGSNQGVGT